MEKKRWKFLKKKQTKKTNYESNCSFCVFLQTLAMNLGLWLKLTQWTWNVDIDISNQLLRDFVNTLWVAKVINAVCSFWSTEIKEERKKEEEERKKKTEASQYPNRRRNMLVSGMVALTAMVGYAFMSGLVQVNNYSAKTRRIIT